MFISLSISRVENMGVLFQTLFLAMIVVNAQYDINTKVPEHVPEDQFTQFVSVRGKMRQHGHY